MTIIKRIFSGVKPEYLFKSYVISGVITALLLSTGVFNSFFKIVVLISLFVLFPFSAFVWDTFAYAMLRGYTYNVSIGIMIFKVFKIVLLYVFSCLIAPIGILYLLFVTRK